MTATLARTLNVPGGIDELLPWLIVAAAMLAATLAAWSLARRVGRSRPHHAASFRRLCRGLGLTPAQRRLLLRLAAGPGQLLPATMLISRGCFEDTVASAAIAAETSTDIDRLRRAIFGTDDDSGSSATA